MRRRLLWFAAAAILGACSQGPWTLRIYNNTPNAILVQVTSAAGVRTSSLAPDTVGFVWSGNDAADLEISILGPSCELLASQAIRAPRFGLALFDGDGRLDVVNESSGAGPDEPLLPDVAACE